MESFYNPFLLLLSCSALSSLSELGLLSDQASLKAEAILPTISSAPPTLLFIIW
jgi:hypothetical protein